LPVVAPLTSPARSSDARAAATNPVRGEPELLDVVFSVDPTHRVRPSRTASASPGRRHRRAPTGTAGAPGGVGARTVFYDAVAGRTPWSSEPMPEGGNPA